MNKAAATKKETEVQSNTKQHAIYTSCIYAKPNPTKFRGMMANIHAPSRLLVESLWFTLWTDSAVCCVVKNRQSFRACSCRS